MSKKKVAYFYDNEIGNFYYGPGHPMKPHRVRMVHNLLLNYGLYKKMYIYVRPVRDKLNLHVSPIVYEHLHTRPVSTSVHEITKFHTNDYVEFLRTAIPGSTLEYQNQFSRFNIGDDCPIFDGLFQFSQLSAGGSIGGSIRLNHKDADIAINWAGGLHHAKKAEASGFCYVNDIVLGILELLKYHKRVLYIDIDVHHGDGVEEAFYTSNRVMTVSFHKFGEFFPGTGDITDIGAGHGKYYALNFPLNDGIDDISYETIFKPVISMVIERFCPEVIVLQCGADSLTGDRLGCFNLTVHGHAMCAKFIRSFNIPMLVVGGGGYTIRNVARAWTYETSVCLDVEIPDKMPYNDYLEYYGPDYRLQIDPSNMINTNTQEYLDKVMRQLIENLRCLEIAPSVQQMEIPKDHPISSTFDYEEDLLDPEDRNPTELKDRSVEHDAELENSDDESGNKNYHDWSIKSASNYYSVKNEDENNNSNFPTALNKTAI